MFCALLACHIASSGALRTIFVSCMHSMLNCKEWTPTGCGWGGTSHVSTDVNISLGGIPITALQMALHCPDPKGVSGPKLLQARQSTKKPPCMCNRCRLQSLFDILEAVPALRAGLPHELQRVALGALEGREFRAGLQEWLLEVMRLMWVTNAIQKEQLAGRRSGPRNERGGTALPKPVHVFS